MSSENREKVQGIWDTFQRKVGREGLPNGEASLEAIEALAALLDAKDREAGGEVEEDQQVTFRAACSGLWYEDPMSCGEVAAVRIGAKTFELPASGDEQGDEEDQEAGGGEMRKKSNGAVLATEDGREFEIEPFESIQEGRVGYERPGCGRDGGGNP